jgi:Ca-activated chloride channel family protein
VKFSESGADVTPKVPPDLYAGDPLTIAAKVASLSGTVTVSGDIGNQPWTVTLPVDKAADGLGISKYWARARISDAEVGTLLGSISRAEADRRILDLALEHHLLTRVTSLVAVDKTPSRPAGTPLTRADVPLNLPAGWDFDKVFGEKLPGAGPPTDGQPMQTPNSQPLLQDASLVQAIAVSHQPASALAKVAAQPTSRVTLPRTATNAGELLWRGFAMLLASFLLALFALRRRLIRAE